MTGDDGSSGAGGPNQGGDDKDAKEKVASLIEAIGFKPIDAGSLKNARYLEPLAGLNVYFGYGAGAGTAVTPTWISRAA